MTKFVLQLVPSIRDKDPIRYTKRLIGNTRVTCDTLERASKRSKYNGEVLRNIRADHHHR